MPIPKKIRELAAEKKYAVFKVPMLAKIGDGPFSNPDWLFEIKWDGYRAISETGGPRTKLYSRNGLSFERKYAAVLQALEKIKHRAILDGEIVVLDAKGHPSFQLLQHYPDIDGSFSIVYYVFDLLEFNGKKLYQLDLIARKKMLKKILPRPGIIRYCDHLENDGEIFFQAVTEKGLEGMMAKKKDSRYMPGSRTSDWLKIRNHNIEEVIICGYTEPRGVRKYFGSLVLGLYDARPNGMPGRRKKMVYVGHAGTGFDEKSMEELYEKMARIKRKTSPFDVPVSSATPVTWIKPMLVANIKYTEWTRDRQLRHPVFMGLRADKKASEVKIKKQVG